MGNGSMERERNFPKVTQIIYCRPDQCSCRSMGLAWIIQPIPCHSSFILVNHNIKTMTLLYYLYKNNYSTTNNIYWAPSFKPVFSKCKFSFSLSLTLTKDLHLNAGLPKVKTWALFRMWQVYRIGSWHPFLALPALILKHSRDSMTSA